MSYVHFALNDLENNISSSLYFSFTDTRVIHSLANSIKEMNSMTGDRPILVIGTAYDPKQLSNNLISAFLHSINMTASNFLNIFLYIIYIQDES